jgi:hypothetical protein
MWIRSQDGYELIDIAGKRFYVMSNRYDKFCVYIDFLTGLEDDYSKLGEYETRERAIEVLNQIQYQLTNISHTSYGDNSGSSWPKTEYQEVVYQMPEK